METSFTRELIEYLLLLLYFVNYINHFYAVLFLKNSQQYIIWLDRNNEHFAFFNHIRNLKMIEPA